MTSRGVVACLAFLVLAALVTGGWYLMVRHDVQQLHVSRIEIANDSDRTLHLGRVRASGLGRGSGAVVKADPAAAQHSGRHDMDAVYPLDADLAAGERMPFDLVVVFRDSGCNQGATVSVGDWPVVVVVDAFGTTWKRPATSDFSWFGAGPARGCAEHHR